MKAGPKKGMTARSPRRSPLRERSAAHRTRASPGSASSTPSTCRSAGGITALTALTATVTNPFDEHRARQAEWNAHAPAFDPDLDGGFEPALPYDFDPRAGHQATALQLAQPVRVVVGYALQDDAF